jgi:hypothetical protein
MYPSNQLSAWASVGVDAWLLGFEVAVVVALRSFRLAQGGGLADPEAQRMIREKVMALIELQQLALAGKLGQTAPDAFGNTIAHYRRAVRANHLRLTP